MSASLIGWIWSESDKNKLSVGSRLVLFALSEHTNIGEHGDWRTFPSQSRIARMCGMSAFTLRKHLKTLVEAELLTIAHQFDDSGRQKQNLYWLNAPKLFEELGGKKLSGGGERNLLQEGKETCYKSFNKESLNNNNTSDNTKFADFWSKYPKKVNKTSAERSFVRLSSSNQDKAINGLKSYPFGDDKKYIMYPTTYINGQRWEDVFEVNVAKKTGGYEV